MSDTPTAPALRHHKTPGEALLPHEEAFAQGVSEGLSATESYRRYVSADVKTTTAMEQGSRLLRKVRARVIELRTAANDAAEAHGFGKDAAVNYLVGVLETPIGEVDEAHRFAQESRDTEYGKAIKMMGKGDAMKQLATIAGWNAPTEVKTTVAGLDELLASLSRPGLPQEPAAPPP